MASSICPSACRLLSQPGIRSLVPPAQWPGSLFSISCQYNAARHVRKRRSMATEATTSNISQQAFPTRPVVPKDVAPSRSSTSESTPLPTPLIAQSEPQVVTTLYNFPSLEPLAFKNYPASFLHAPLRRDILHRAIVYEASRHRLGRAKTQYRWEVNGSGRKLRKQKGSGMARLGDRSSPMLRGGAKAHGPKPRDFSIGMPKKIYDLAWRIALSYRYRRGQLILTENNIDSKLPKTQYMLNILRQTGWDRRKTTFVTMQRRPKMEFPLNNIPRLARSIVIKDVDIKDLLEGGRIVIEMQALDWLLKERGFEVAATENYIAQVPTRKKSLSKVLVWK